MMKIKIIDGIYGVCRLNPFDAIPDWAIKGEIYSITNTKEELSILCLESNIPSDMKCERNWRILKVEGPLDFSLIGILASISSILAKSEISIFAISTYDTDYILLKEKDLQKGVNALVNEGYDIDA